VANVWRRLGEWEVHDVTPASVNAPAIFPGAVSQMTTDEQDGSRAVTLAWWVVVPSSSAEHQRQLYDAIDRMWDALEDGWKGVTYAHVERLDSVGRVEVGGTDYWGGRLTVEVSL
jgi:hypothetical protein